jgi:hypothetical protein
LTANRVHAAFATVIVDKLVSRGLAERTAYGSHLPNREGPEPLPTCTCYYELTADSVRRGGEFCQPDPRVQWPEGFS